MKDNLLYFLGCYGGWIGAILIGGTYLHDPLMMGVRGFFEWNIAWKGHATIATGYLLLLSSWLVDRYWR